MPTESVAGSGEHAGGVVPEHTERGIVRLVPLDAARDADDMRERIGRGDRIVGWPAAPVVDWNCEPPD